MNARSAKMLGLVVRLLLVLLSQLACTTLPGAPKGDDAYEAESASEAIEEEEEEEAVRDVNR